MKRVKGSLSGSSRQESAPSRTSATKRSHRSSTTPVATEEEDCSSDPVESKWHGVIEQQDWVTLQRHLEQLTQPQQQDVSSTTHTSTTTSTNKQVAPMTPPKPKKTASSTLSKSKRKSLNWLKRSVVSTMGNMSSKNHHSSDQGSENHPEPIDEHEILDTSLGGDPKPTKNNSTTPAIPLDKESLLQSNAEGRTPLQMALYSPDAPDQLIRHLLRAQPKAVFMVDNKGRLPLHFAVVRNRSLETITELVELHPDALHAEDEKGKNPMDYAMEVSKRKTNLEYAPRTFWAAPALPGPGAPEAIWQENQTHQWEMARYLLQKSAYLRRYQDQSGAATHPEPQFTAFAVDHQHPFLIRTGRVPSSQQPVLIEAMLHAAPPTVVALLLEASAPLFQAAQNINEDDDDDDGEEFYNGIIAMGCSAFYLAIFRQYPITILQRLGELLGDNEEIKTVRDETGLGLVSAHYVTSCFEKSKLLEYVAEESFMVTMEQCIMEGQLPEGNIQFLEWWEKLKYLILFCADKDPDDTPDDYLLHAALENTDTPPNVIRLLLALFPGSAHLPDSKSAHPLHLFSMHRDYIPRNYESPYMHGLNVMDMLLSLDESAVFHSFQKRLPLHHAIASGRTWSTIHPLISSYRSSLRMPDPITKLPPCLLAAAYHQDDAEEEHTRLLQLTRNQYSAIVWQGLSSKQQETAVQRIRQFESLKRLDTIFELFRRYPHCVESIIEVDQKKMKKKESVREIAVKEDARIRPKLEKKEREESAGPEMITFHYLSWCYNKVNGVWHVARNNMDILQSAILVAEEHRVLSQKSPDFVNWWEILKNYFWHCYKALNIPSKPTIPRNDDYLLHVAVSIPTTPPDIVELILGLYPEAASMSLPGSSLFPLHLVCRTTSYTPQFFEVSRQTSTLQLVQDKFPEATFARTDEGQLPIHVAIESGKTINELRPLIEQGPLMVSTRDPCSELFPFQLMAMLKPLPGDLRLRFRTIAANRHSSEWNAFSGQRKMKAIRAVEKEYHLDVLSSSFELLRLAPSVVVAPDEIEVNEPVGTRTLQRQRGNNVMGRDSHNTSEEPRRARRRIRRHLSRDGSVGASSAFSTIDMMSTISNVSSHLSFRRAASISDGNMTGSMLGDDDDPESEASDIWSEDASFYANIGQAPGRKAEKETNDHAPFTRIDHPKQSKSARQQNTKSKWEAPVHFGEEAIPSDVAPADPVPKLIVEAVDIADDVSYLDNINPRSRSIRTNSSFRKAMVGETSSSDSDRGSWVESKRDSTVEPEDLQLPPEPSTRDDSMKARRRSTVPIENDESSRSEETSARASSSGSGSDSCAESSEDEDSAASAASSSEEGSEDDSIQDEIVATSYPPQTETEEAEPILFRLRKKSCQRTGGPMPIPSRTRNASLNGSRQSVNNVDMDFLSILNASLPEGKMDFLSTLKVTSDSLPPGSGSMPTGLDAGISTINRMERIKEFPNESGHDTKAVQEKPSKKSSLQAALAASRSSKESKGMSCPPSINNSPKGNKNRRRTALEISPTQGSYTSRSSGKTNSCLHCEKGGREVMMLPCSHLCVCRLCAKTGDIRSCPVCFGPVEEKRICHSGK